MNNNQSAPVLQTPENKVVGIMAFAGLFILFSLPLIGWIICLITALVSKNKNIVHFAVAYFIVQLVIILLVVIAFAVIVPLLINTVVKSVGGLLGDIGIFSENGGIDIGGIINGLFSDKGFDISSIIGSVIGGENGEGIDMEALLDNIKKNITVDVSGVDLSKYGVTKEDIGDLDLSAITVGDLEKILPEGVDVNDILEEAGVDPQSFLMDYFGNIGAGFVRAFA